MYITHEMRIVRSEESGLEEWACPTCGRRILLRWPPNYAKQVIDPGDERACHVGSSADHTAQTHETAAAAAEDTAGTGETPAGQHRRIGHRWLRETGLEALSGPVGRRHVNPPEAV